MQKRTRRKFTAEYKAEVVRLVRDGGKAIGEVSRELDLTETAVRHWVKQAGIDAGGGGTGALTTALRADLRKSCLEWLVGQAGRDTKVLLEVAATYMDPAQIKVYEGALKEGFQALPGESPS